MNTNTNDLAKALANAVLTTVSLDDFKAEMARRGLRVDNPCDCVPERLTDDDVRAEMVRRGLDRLTDTQVLTQIAARGLAQVVLNEHITDEQVLDALDRRDLTGDVLEAADDDDLWQAIDAKTYTVTENIGDLYENDLLDALDEDVKERMCRAWVEENPQEVREILLKRGEPDERDDEWVVGEVFRRGLAGDVLRDVADKMRLTY